MSRYLVLGALLLVGVAHADDPFGGHDRYPEFRNFSGLPGGGFGIRPDGVLGISGAMTLSTPVAYSLTKRQYVVMVGAMAFDRSFKWPESHGNTADANGTAAGMLGLNADEFDFTVGGMLLSSIGDSVLNLQASYKRSFSGLQFGAGIQDVFNTGGASGEFYDLKHGGGTSRSVFGVASYAVPDTNVYLSAGVGSARFRHGFGSVSVPLGNTARAYLEHDGFNLNYGAGVEFGHVTATLGLVRSDFLTYSLAYRF